jgi:hypothetical protein
MDSSIFQAAFLLLPTPSSRPSPSFCWEKVAEGRMREVNHGAFSYSFQTPQKAVSQNFQNSYRIKFFPTLQSLELIGSFKKIFSPQKAH